MSTISSTTHDTTMLRSVSGPRRTRAPICAAVLLLTGSGCGSPNVETPRSATLATKTTVIVEAGGDPSKLADRALVPITNALRNGDSISVLIVDGPNADALEPLPLPGTTTRGRLDSEAANEIATREAVASIDDAIRDTLTSELAAAPELSTGRDLLGAAEDALVHGPRNLVLVFSSGGLHRTIDDDWSDPNRWAAIDLGLAPPVGTCVEFVGLGQVPTVDGGPPPKALTTPLTDAWQSWADAARDACGDEESS